jgi:mycofactocin precursor
MTQQAVTEATHAHAGLTAAEPAGGDGAGDGTGGDRTGSEPAVADDLLVEEISIDGMCGVY